VNWFRWYYGTFSDPNFAVVAKRCGQPKHVVLAVWAALLETAGNATKRGDVSSFDPETIGLALDLEADVVTSVFTAFMAKELVTKDRQVSAWDKRQHYDYSTDRVRKFRNKDRQDTSDDPPDETVRNGAKRTETQETPDQIRTDTDILEPTKPNKPSKRVRSLDDVVVDEEAAEIVKGKGVDAFAELPRYRDHYRSRGKVLKDYRAGFHNWLRKAIDFKNERDPPKPAAASQANAKSDYEQWRDLLASYVPGKFWPSNRGARPESGYCDAPEDLLTEWKRRLERAA
jgi:hypothetical protein